jgi:hypothetical protein
MKGAAYLSVLFATLIGCESSSVQNSLNGHEYVPLKSGQYVDMEVITSVYASNQVAYTTHGMIRIETGASLVNTSGQTCYAVQYSSAGKDNAWQIDSTQIAWDTPDKIFYTEGGQVINLMVLPLSEYSTWNGHAFNVLGPQYFMVKNFGKAFTSNNQLFPNTITIVRQNDSTLIRQHKRVEVYAEGIGLIYKEQMKVNFCTSSDCYGKGQIQSGKSEISIIKKYSNR